MNCLAGSKLFPRESPEGFLVTRGSPGLTRASLCRKVDVEYSAATGVERAASSEELSRRVLEAPVGSGGDRGSVPPRVTRGGGRADASASGGGNTAER